ncbi:MAG: hypothetical protein ABIF09_14915 [Gemmatimonadota bacterium]
MREPVVVNLFLTVRVLLVGGILLVLPRISRKGLLFGVYVGEEFVKGDGVRKLLGRWRRACLIVMAVSLFVGLAISFAGYPVPGNLTGTAVLLLAGVGLYLLWPRRVRLVRVCGSQFPVDAGPRTRPFEPVRPG